MTTTITDPTKLPCGPDYVEISPLHLSISGLYDNGSRHNVHLIENGDLGVILQRGQSDHQCDRVPHNVEDTGLVVVSLGVDDGCHDQVHYSHRSAEETEEVLGQAIEALITCRYALRRIRLA